MATHTPTRDEAFALLKEYNSNDGLVRHGLAVEGVMRYFAEKFGEDPDKWRVNHESSRLAPKPGQTTERMGGAAPGAGNEQSSRSNDRLGTLATIGTRLEGPA